MTPSDTAPIVLPRQHGKRSALRKRAVFDLIGLGCIAGVILVVCYLCDAWERFFAVVSQISAWDAWHIHEVLILALLSPLLAAIYSYRRKRELEALLRDEESFVTSLEQAQQNASVCTVKLHNQTYLDELTQLANRKGLVDHLESLLTQQANDEAIRAIVCFGIDNFKRVNRNFGYATGDTLLRAVAERLTVRLRELHTFIARPGGDLFVVVLEGLKHSFDAEVVTARLLEALNTPFEVNGLRVTSGASAGIMIFNDGHPEAESLLHDVETAMYEAKRLGRGRFVVFDSAARERLQHRARLARDLPLAISRNELGLAYQPIVSLSTGAMTGVEGLLRWRHSIIGPISPGEFIPLAEETDLILEIGAWVLEQGCRQLADWIARYPMSAPQVMSLNVSRKQFSQPDLSEQIGRVIRNHAVPPERVQVEITEDSYLGDEQAALRTMRDIKAQGVKLAIDDFGAGSSTLVAVQQFPIDTLKVDRSLVADTARSADSAAILHSLAVLVRNLNVKLVAEGIEDVEQVIALQALGCQYGQGYLFGRPMAPEAIEETFCVGSSVGLTASGASAFGNSWEHRFAAFQRLELEDSSASPTKASAASNASPTG